MRSSWRQCRRCLLDGDQSHLYRPHPAYNIHRGTLSRQDDNSLFFLIEKSFKNFFFKFFGFNLLTIWVYYVCNIVTIQAWEKIESWMCHHQKRPGPQRFPTFHYFTLQVESEFHIIQQHSGLATCNNKSLLSQSEIRGKFKQKIQERKSKWNPENRSPNARSGRLTTLIAPTIKNWKGFGASELQARLGIALLHSLVSHKAWGRAAALEQRRHSKRWSRVIIPQGNPAIWLMTCWMLKTNINSLTSLMKTGYPAQLWKLIAKDSSPLRCQQV